MTVIHVMWCDVTKHGMPYVGEMRGEPGPEVRTPTKIPCPWCGGMLVRITGYTERVLITALRGGVVNGQQCVEIHTIPDDFDILGCAKCRHNFTTEK